MTAVGSGQVRSARTARQREVVHLLAQGFTIREIADTLRISTRTVRGEVAQVMNQLGKPEESRSRAEIEVRRGENNPLVSAAAPEAAWVKFWAIPGLAAAVAGILMLLVGLRYW
jgi:hypothetical protein